MKLKDKPVYPFTEERKVDDGYGTRYIEISKGLTYREWLVGMLVSNQNLIEWNTSENPMTPDTPDYEFNAQIIIAQADAIIKELEA